MGQKMSLYVLIILVIAILGFATFTGWKYFRSSQTPGIDITKSPIDKTENWETYTNEKYGYGLNYPEGWFAFWSQWTPGGAIYYTRDTNWQDSITFSSKYPSNYIQDSGASSLTINRENGEFFIKGSNFVDDFWNKLGKRDEVTGEIVNKFVGRKIIDGVDFIIFEQYGWDPYKQEYIWTPQALFMHKGEFFWIRGNNAIETDLFNLIIDTFKFTR